MPLPPQKIPSRLIEPLVRFIQVEVSSGAMLLGAAVLALTWANAPVASSYFSLTELPIAGITSKMAINDGLMAIFFLLVGLEIKREVRIGELAGWRKAALPIAGAIGGMIVPALIFTSMNLGTPAARGWGIPMATDIAIALGVLNLAGKTVPLSLKAFLAALAIADDLGAVAVIAIFYGNELQLSMLPPVGYILLGLVTLRVFRTRNLIPYLILGVGLWWYVWKLGVHPTVAGVVLAMFIPVREKDGESATPLARLEARLHPWVVYFIVPVFVFANVGIPIGSSVSQGMTTSSGQGIALGLLIGKPVGICFACWLAVRAGLASLPAKVTWHQLMGVGVLGGIGFTMSLFVTELAYQESSLISAAKGAILVSSCAAAVAGLILLRRFSKCAQQTT